MSVSQLLRSSKRLLVDLPVHVPKLTVISRSPLCQNYATATSTNTSSSSDAITSPVSSIPPSGETNIIKVTESCVKRLTQILEEEGTFLRVSVEGGGCSGFQYKFHIDKEMAADDIIVKSGLKKQQIAALVVTDPVSLDLIKGSTLDYEVELIRSAFRILSNPLAEQGCSCGASFNMKL